MLPRLIDRSRLGIEPETQKWPGRAVIREEILPGARGQGPARALGMRGDGGEHDESDDGSASHGVRRMAISSTLVPDRRVSVVSRDTNPGRSKRSVCVPGGSSSRCTGRSPRRSPST